MSQPEFVNSVGIQNLDRKIDEVIYETRSYNSKYSDIIVKRGLNPVVPDGYEVQATHIDDSTGIITLTCVKNASSLYKPGIVDIPPPPEIPKTGIAADVRAVKDMLESEDRVLRDVTAQPRLGPAPKHELDDLRRQAKEMSILPIYAPTKVATRAFEGSREDVDSESKYLWVGVGLLFIIVIVTTILMYAKSKGITHQIVFDKIRHLFGPS